ncbi:MAG: hypothetical protein JWM80_5823 [Cyanobacteria bacterium RYN_339]|nr:hypothetical protein [Cyanobacteria bacterium RYN_339]
MPRLMTFTCPELDMTYDAVYAELAGYLELDVEATAGRFAPDDAVARVRYFRRLRQRQHVQLDLADVLGIDPTAVYAAVGEEGARILLEALQARRAGWELTVKAAIPVIDELEDLICR